MPIYEYLCEACGESSTALLPRWDSPDPPCPSCGQQRLRRLVSTFATAGREDDSDADFGGDFGGGDFGGDFGGGDFGGEEGYGSDAGDYGDSGADDDDW